MTATIAPQEGSPDAGATALGPKVEAGRPAAFRIDIPKVTAADLAPLKWQLYLSLTGLALGALMGILQALERLDVNLYDRVGLASYYQGLTLHGVGLALVFTFCFANSFLSLLTMRGFGPDGKLLPGMETAPVDLDLIYGMGAGATEHEWAYIGEPHIDSYEGEPWVDDIRLWVR